MKINHQILSLPPYISTSWKHILSLHAMNKNGTSILLICLNNGTNVEIPGIDPAIIDTIFGAHAQFLEHEASSTTLKHSPKPVQDQPLSALPTDQIAVSFPLRIGIGGLEGLGSLLQHHPEQADSPNLPPEILNKIATISKAVGIDDPHNFPKPEPHCNCLHCQIAKAIQDGHQEEETLEEESISDEDLTFRTWDIQQSADKLYTVKNPLDLKEQYSVFLGDPIGCTCGEKNCEHIQAVLKS